MYQDSHKNFQDINEINVQVSYDRGACYGVSKCTGIFFQGTTVMEEALQMSKQRMKMLNPYKEVAYKFVGVEQAGGTKRFLVSQETSTQTASNDTENRTPKQKLNDCYYQYNNSSSCIPIERLQINNIQLERLDQIVQNELQQNNMMLKQLSEERVYMKRDCNGRALKSLQ